MSVGRKSFTFIIAARGGVGKPVADRFEIPAMHAAPARPSGDAIFHASKVLEKSDRQGRTMLFRTNTGEFYWGLGERKDFLVANHVVHESSKAIFCP